MKIKSFLFAVCAIAAVAWSCNTGGLHIRVKDADDYYRFSAKFDKAVSPRIHRFINSQIAPTRIESDRDIDITTILDDETKFQWEASPGEIMIYLDRQENSKASYVRIKQMCEKIKDIIQEKP